MAKTDVSLFQAFLVVTRGRVALALLGVCATLIPMRAQADGFAHVAVPAAALIRALDFEDAEIRAGAAHALGFQGVSRAVAPLLRRLAAPEPDPVVRSALYRALGRLRDPRAGAVLIRCVTREARPELRSDCATGLGRLGPPAALDRLIEALEQDRSILVRSRVVDALGAYVEQRAVATLSALVAEGRNRSLRYRAIRALGRTGARDAAPVLLAALGRARGANERIEIVTALGRLGARSAVASLQALRGDTDDAVLRSQIAVALGTIRDGSPLPTLITLLDQPAAVRLFAVRALAALGRPRAAAPIAALSVRLSARFGTRSEAELLADLTLQEAALRALIAIDPAAGGAAFQAAARRHPVAPISPAALRIGEAEVQARRVALHGLGYSGAAGAARTLTGPPGLEDPDFRLRAAAVLALGRLGAAGTMPGIIAALADPAAEVRWTAAQVLGSLKSADGVGALLKSLADPTAEVRRRAALSLGYQAAIKARPALGRLRDRDPDGRVRAAAAFAASLLAGADQE